MKKLALSMALIFASTAHAEGYNDYQPTIQTINTHWQITADSIKLPPEGQITAGHSVFVAGSYLFEFNPYLFGGLTGMASVTGGHGGFFILGLNGGVHIPIGQYLFAEAGSFLGAGGGYQQIVGGGLFIQPYVDAGVNYKGWQVGARYSYLKTPDHGKISSHQVGLVINMPTHFYISGEGQSVADNFDFTPVFVTMGYSNYISNSLSLKNIQQLGFELGYYFTPHFFGVLSPAGAFQTGTHQNGYMEIFASLGYNQPLSHIFSLIGQLGLGAAGGGSTATKDGGMLRILLGIQAKMTNHYAVEANGGYLKALTTSAKAGVVEGKLVYNFGYPAKADGIAKHYDDIYTIPWQLRILNQTYFNPKHTNDTNPNNVQLLGLQFDLGVTDHWYITAQTDVAYHGMSGGYASVFLGGGFRTKPMTEPGFAIAPEFLVGAAGAGYMAVGDSILFQPTLNIFYNFNRSFGLYVGGGQFFTSKSGNMSTPILNAGFTWHFDSLTD